MILEIKNIGSVGNVRIDENDVAELAASIDRHGLLQPIVVTATEDDMEFDWYVVAGHRRLAALKSLGQLTAEVTINETVESASDLMSAQYAENVHRKDLSAYERMQVALDLKGEGLKQEQVADELGLSKAEVSKMQRAARVIGALPNSQDAVRLGEEALFALADAPIDEEGQADLIRENALRLIVNGESRSVAQALGKAEREATDAWMLELLQPLLAELADAGVRFMTDEEWRNKRTWDTLATHQKETRYGGQLGFNDKQVAAHRELDCHAVHMGSGYSGIVLSEYCLKPKAHSAGGKSELKEASAEEKADQAELDKQERLAKKQAKQLRQDEVKDFMLGKWTPKQVTALMRDTLSLPADAKRVAAKALELERIDSPYGNYPDYEAMLDKWVDELPVTKQPFAAVLFLAAYAYIELPYAEDKYREVFDAT